MKKIGLLSDTHGHMDNRILHHLQSCDEIWHAGDIGNLLVTEQLIKLKPLKAVYGNIDDHKTRQNFPEYLSWDDEGLSFLLIHIAGPFGKYTFQVKELINNLKPQVLICGHSHILKVAKDTIHHLTYINPGAAGKHGFHIYRTMLRFDIDEGAIKNAEVVQLDKRNNIGN